VAPAPSAPARESAVPLAGSAPAAARGARLRVALFVLVLVLAAGAAWGAGRLLSLQLGVDASQVDHGRHHVSGTP
jgi:hypothetical protein